MVRFLMALFVAVVASFPAAAQTSVSVGVWSVSDRHPHGHRHRGHGHDGHRWGHRPRSSFYFYSAPAYAYAPPPRVIYYPAYMPAVVPTQQCTFFNGDAVIDGSGQPFYGSACLFTDGRWHIVP